MKNIHSLSHRSQEPENGVLYIVGTPIGNLNDISPSNKYSEKCFLNCLWGYKGNKKDKV